MAEEQVQLAQYDCSVSYVENKGKDNQRETPIPQCDTNGNRPPCFRLVVDSAKSTGTGQVTRLALEVNHRETVPSGTHVEGRCIVTNN